LLPGTWANWGEKRKRAVNWKGPQKTEGTKKKLSVWRYNEDELGVKQMKNLETEKGGKK